MDVIILDLHLRQGSGFGVMKALARSRLRPHIIIFTNYDLPEYQKIAAELGATYFLDKAQDFGRVPALLQEMLSRRALAREPVKHSGVATDSYCRRLVS